MPITLQIPKRYKTLCDNIIARYYAGKMRREELDTFVASLDNIPTKSASTKKRVKKYIKDILYPLGDHIIQGDHK